MIKTVTWKRTVVALNLFGACATFASEWNWKSDVKDNTPFTAYNFADPLNWSEESGSPSTTADTARFDGGTRFVRLQDSLSVNTIKASGGLRLLCGGELSLADLTYKSYTYPVQTLFADRVSAVGNSLSVSVSDVAADIDLKGGKLLCGGDAAGFCWNLYANSPDTSRVDPLKNLSQLVMGSGGSPRFFAPRGASAQTTTWRLVANSPYAEIVGSAVQVAPGALVTGGASRPARMSAARSPTSISSCRRPRPLMPRPPS